MSPVVGMRGTAPSGYPAALAPPQWNSYLDEQLAPHILTPIPGCTLGNRLRYRWTTGGVCAEPAGSGSAIADDSRASDRPHDCSCYYADNTFAYRSG
jgi:hypothetical protein